MKTLIMMVGLPRSGKSTKAKKLGFPIVNPDSIRLAIHGQPFYKPAEGLVWSIAHIMVKSLFEAGHDTVTLDATNVTFERRAEWLDVAEQTIFIVMDTSPQECKKRAMIDGKPYLIEVIDKMAKEWDMEKPWEK